MLPFAAPPPPCSAAASDIYRVTLPVQLLVITPERKQQVHCEWRNRLEWRVEVDVDVEIEVKRKMLEVEVSLRDNKLCT